MEKNEPGCKAYIPSQSKEDEHDFMVWEEVCLAFYVSFTLVADMCSTRLSRMYWVSILTSHSVLKMTRSQITGRAALILVSCSIVQVAICN